MENRSHYPARLLPLLLLLLTAISLAADDKRMPKEDVIEFPAIADGLCVQNLFQSNMVLQRDRPNKIWGWATAGEKVRVTFAGQTQSTSASDDRTWSVTFPAMPANRSAQSMTVESGDQTLELSNILVGDVWVLGGQSNMEFPLDKIENGKLEIVSANYPQIRILTVPAQNGAELKPGFPRLHEWSSWSNRHFRKGDWDVCSPEIARELSAIGYVFARRIHMAAQIPIGVIDASRGGSTVETWTPNSVLRTIDTPEVRAKLAEWDEKVASFDAQQDLEQRIAKHHDWVENMTNQGKKIPADRTVPSDLRPGPADDHNRPGNCFASMIHPLAGLSVKGAIFHQGYNNCFNGSQGADMYAQIFPEMITAWRAAFDDSEMAFGIISLCTQGTRQTRENYVELMLDAGPYIREAQYQTFLEMYQAGDKQIGYTSSFDLRRRWYHPQQKIPAGERIARWALATQYGFANQIRWKPPMLIEMKVADDHLTLAFDEAVLNLDDGGVIEGFAIAGEDGRFHPADASHRVTGKDDRGRDKKDTKALVLTSSMVPKPIHYRYAWARSPLGNLQATGNTDVLFATQRSDSWSMSDSYSMITDKESETPGQLSRRERGELLKAFKAEDLKRKTVAAQALLDVEE